MYRMLKTGLAAASMLALALPSAAQTYRDSGGTVVPGMVPIEPGIGPLFTNSNPGVISGSFSATLSGFQPTPSYSQLSVNASSSRVALPSGAVVVVYNTGSYVAYVTLGNSSVSATTGYDAIQPNSWMAFTVGTNTYLAGITASGTTALNISGGSGLPTGAGGGAGGGGSSSITTWASGTLGSMANYGTSPGAVLVPGVNAYVTNQPIVTTTPKTGALTMAGCTVGTSSAQCLAAGTYNHVQIQNTHSSNAIACSWGGAAALNSNNSIQLAAGQPALWGPTTAGVPTVALNCIASGASTPLYLEYN
ncbi:MAG TPA: hypothetical protein VMI72_12695 [Roseiarcus sp.]|nr:hypothetical protein [Roseiarcus sp.]